jgi:hypothetical protein
MMLLGGDSEQITTALGSMTKQRQNIEEEIATIVFYMQGGLNYMDAYSLSIEQLEGMSKVINNHYEQQNNALSGGRKIR